VYVCIIAILSGAFCDGIPCIYAISVKCVIFMKEFLMKLDPPLFFFFFIFGQLNSIKIYTFCAVM
jgi:hypothetical protein